MTGLKKTLISFAIIAVLSALTSCLYLGDMHLPYNSDTALDDQLIGEWNLKKKKETKTILIKAFDERNYYDITLITSTGSKSDTVKFTGFSTKINNTSIVCAKIQHNSMRRSDKNQYAYFNYDIKNGKILSLSFLKKRFVDETFTTEKALQDYFETNMTKKGFWSKKVKFKKK